MAQDSDYEYDSDGGGAPAGGQLLGAVARRPPQAAARELDFYGEAAAATRPWPRRSAEGVDALRRGAVCRQVRVAAALWTSPTRRGRSGRDREKAAGRLEARPHAVSDAEAWHRRTRRAAAPEAAAAARRAAAQHRRQQLSAFSLGGLVERFDEQQLLLADLAARRLRRAAHARRVAPARSTNPGARASPPARRRPSPVRRRRWSSAACGPASPRSRRGGRPGGGEAAAAFDARVAALGAPFAARLAAFLPGRRVRPSRRARARRLASARTPRRRSPPMRRVTEYRRAPDAASHAAAPRSRPYSPTRPVPPTGGWAAPCAGGALTAPRDRDARAVNAATAARSHRRPARAARAADGRRDRGETMRRRRGRRHDARGRHAGLARRRADAERRKDR